MESVSLGSLFTAVCDRTVRRAALRQTHRRQEEFIFLHLSVQHVFLYVIGFLSVIFKCLYEAIFVSIFYKKKKKMNRDKLKFCF